MKKLTLLILTIALITSSLTAQVIEKGVSNPMVSKNNYATVISLKGKAKYASPNSSKFKKLKEGAILDAGSVVKLKKKSELTLLKAGKMQTLNSKGKHALNSIQVPASAVEDDFFAFLNDASGFGGPGGGGGIGDSTAKGGGGHGSGDQFIGKTPPGGKVPAKAITFAWNGNSSSDYAFKIYKAADQTTPVFSKTTNTNSLQVNLAEADDIKTGEEYVWQVEKNVEGVTMETPKINITPVKASAASDVLKELEETKTYTESSDWQKALRFALALEKSNLLYDADQKYRQALKDFPNNELVKSSYTLFQNKVMTDN